MLLGIVVLLGACGGGDDTADESTDTGDTGDTATEEGATDTAAGEEIFKKNCASCHGADLAGGMGPDLTKVGADHTADEIKDIIENGTGQMPPQKQVSGEDRDTLANWLAEKK